MLANLIRMVFCIAIGFCLLAVQGDLTGLKVDGRALLIMFGSGVTTSAFVVAWLISVKTGAYMMLDVFLLIGVLVPMLLCNWLYQEPITSAQWIGAGVVLIAVAFCFVIGVVFGLYPANKAAKMKPIDALHYGG